MGIIALINIKYSGLLTGFILTMTYCFVNYRIHSNNTINNGEYLYKGLLQIANEYSGHYLYFKVIRKIVWHYVASVILLGGLELLKRDMFDKFSISYLKLKGITRR